MIYVIGIIVLYFLGKGTLGALYKKDSVKDMGMTDIMLTGGIVVIGLAEAAHLGAVVLGRSFLIVFFCFWRVWQRCYWVLRYCSLSDFQKGRYPG